MATITERFGFTKPAGNDPASIVPLNSNTDLIEQYLGRTQDMIAPLYDDTATYDVGDIVTYESNLYKCITAISTAETFDPTKWEATTASEDILTLQNVQGYDEYDETQTYAVGDYAIYNNIVYECTTAVTTAEPFDSTKWTATSIEQIIGGVKGDISQLNSRINMSNVQVSHPTCKFSGTEFTCTSTVYQWGKLVVVYIKGYTGTATIPVGQKLFDGLPLMQGATELFAAAPSGRYRLTGTAEGVISIYEPVQRQYISATFVYFTN